MPTAKNDTIRATVPVPAKSLKNEQPRYK